MELSDILVVCGPTASGKSELATTLAVENHGAIINADALQIYKNIEICSASPTLIAKHRAPHHLYNFLNYDEEYSVWQYCHDARIAIAETIKTKLKPIIVGGSGLYLYSLLYGIDNIPSVDVDIRIDTRNLYNTLGHQAFWEKLLTLIPGIANKIHMNDTQRLIRVYEVFQQTGKPIWAFYGQSSGITKQYKVKIHKILPERRLLYGNINSRIIQMMQLGAINEVIKLNDNWHNVCVTVKKALLVCELQQFISGDIPTLDLCIELAQKNSRHYAKRQYTWFRNKF